MKKLKTSLRTRVAAYAAAGTTLAVTGGANTAHASVVSVDPPDIAVPNTFVGVYLNFVTGVSSTNAVTASGYDLNPYGDSGLSFYFPTGAGGVTSGGVFSALAPGATVGPGSTFTGDASSSPTALANFRTTGTEYLGVEFLNESTGVVNYGYVHFSTNTATGLPATILDYAYENTGAAITLNAVPEPGSVAVMATLGLGAAGLRAWRRRQPAA